MPNILVVDDEKSITDLIEVYLKNENFQVYKFYNGKDALSCLKNTRIDLAVLDIMLPDMDGFAICRRIRAQTEAPILFLTARTDEPSVLTGLGIGADDYLVKPFRLAELRARVNAHLRRQNRAPQHRLVRGGVCFDLAAKSAAVGGTQLPFTKSEYAICEFLALHAGQTFGKEQIYEAVFGYDGTADDTAITQHIKNIRAKLRTAGLASPETVLKTVWGVGYLWNAADT